MLGVGVGEVEDGLFGVEGPDLRRDVRLGLLRSCRSRAYRESSIVDVEGHFDPQCCLDGDNGVGHGHVLVDVFSQ